MKTNALVLSVCAISLLVGACGGIRVVKKTQTGGELALLGSQEKAREEATKYMTAQCPSGFDILEEGEAVVGSTSSSNAQQTTSWTGRPAVATTTSTEDKREWRIKYQCKGSAGEQKSASIHELVVRF